jgi:hypothetical protein
MSDDKPDHVKPATSDSTAELRSELTALRARYAAGAFAATLRPSVCNIIAIGRILVQIRRVQEGTF